MKVIGTVVVLYFSNPDPPGGGGMVGASTRYYFGAYEKDIDRFGNTIQTDYIYTPILADVLVK